MGAYSGTYGIPLALSTRDLWGQHVDLSLQRVDEHGPCGTSGGILGLVPQLYALLLHPGTIR